MNEAKPMSGEDRLGDQYCLGKSTCGGCDPNCPANTDRPKPVTPQPVTPPAKLPEQGEFERALLKFCGIAAGGLLYTKEEISKGLSSAHSRDVEAARKRIAALEAEVKQLKADNADMLSTLDRLARLGNEPTYGNSIGNQIALEAVRKHKGG